MRDEKQTRAPWIAELKGLSRGTRFTLSPFSAEGGASQNTPARTADVSTTKILVMDDEEMIRRAVATMLKANGLSVETVVDGREAIEVYRRAMEEGKPFQAVLLDLIVPGGIGGKEAIEGLLQTDKNVKAIISSGYPNDPVMIDFAAYGFAGKSLKPYTATRLLEVINSVLQTE